ncbi:MAG: tetratricopeptide repeat protein [Opitutaceae bacterium]|nr:tetratricopeptide repeat protein [Opitutaceae bacterium]
MSKFTSFVRIPAVFAALAIGLAAQQTPPREYFPSEATGEILPQYKTAVDAKNYDGAIAMLDAQLSKVAADSYDAALLLQLKTQTLLQKGDFTKAIEPMEKGLALSDSKTPTYYDERATRELVYFLAQLYAQEAINTKNPTLAVSLYDKSEKAIQRWLKINNNKPTSESQLFYTQMLYGRATLNADKPDLEVVKRALEQADIGLHLSTRPRDTLYLIKLVCLQQLNRNEEATEMLELMVKQKPDSSSFWSQLAALYLSTGNDLRAALTIERAQKFGQMNTPKDNFNLIGIYFNIGEYEASADLLEAGLKSGRVENDPKNWELLALNYQQLQRPFKAIEALKQATKAFPKSGQLEFLIAQAYHSMEKAEDALPHLQAAVAKGELQRPHQVYLFLAYIAYELKKFDIAMEAAKKAAETPEGAKDGQSMVRAIEDILKDREAKKNKM